MAGHAFAGAGEAQPFLRGGLHVYPGSGNSYRKGDVCLHLRDEILQLRPLGNHGHVDVAHPITRRSDLFRHVFQKQQGIRTLVLGVGVREMPPDISQSRRAQQGDRELLGCLYQALLSWETLTAETLHVLADYPAHTAAALYLVTAEGK